MIRWHNADVMLGHRLRRWANIIPTKTLQAFKHECKREFIFSQHFLNNQLFDLATSNAIFDMFTRTVSQKCLQFPTN